MKLRETIHDILIIAGLAAMFRLVSPWVYIAMLKLWLHLPHALLYILAHLSYAILGVLMGYTAATFVKTGNKLVWAILLAVASLLSRSLFFVLRIQWYHRIHVAIIIVACIAGVLLHQRICVKNKEKILTKT